MLKVEATIEEVVNGEVTQLRIGDDVYYITHIGYYKDIEEADDKQPIPQDSVLEKGKKIAQINHSAVYENIFNDIIEHLGSKYDRDMYRNIVKRYYRDSPDSTIKSLISTYKRAVENKFDGTLEKPQRRYKRYRRRKPAGAIGKDKTYKVWIKEDDYNKVKRAMFTFGATPTTDFIARESGLTVDKVRAVVHYMIDEGKVKRTTNEDGSVFYSYTG